MSTRPACSRRRFGVTLAFLALPLLSSGCVSYWKGKEMQTNIVALQTQVEQLTESQRKLREKHEEDLKTLAERIVATKKDLMQAIERLRTGSADSGLELENIRRELDTLKGMYAELEEKAKAAPPADVVAAGMAAGLSADATPLPEKAPDLYRYGYERKKGGDCAEASRAFATYAHRFPRKERADNSLFLMADCQHMGGEYAKSVRTLEVILKKYPKGDKIDDALLLMHDNFVALKRCKDALPFLETLIADHPKSNLVPRAQKKLKQTRRKCK